VFKIRPDGDAGIDCFSDPKSTQLGVGPNIDLVDFGSGLCIGACRPLGVDNGDGIGSGLCIGACRLLGVDNGAEDANGARAGSGLCIGACRLLGVDNGAEGANGARDGDGDAVGVGVEIVRGVGLC